MEWTPIPGFSKRYRIAENGSILSLRMGQTLSQGKKRGYYRVKLFGDNGKQYTRSVHRLVALTFIPNPHGKPQINHKNGIKHDNRIENLEWATAKENVHHAFKIGLTRYELRPPKIRNKKEIPNWISNNSKPINQYLMTGRLIATYPSLKDAAMINKISISAICNALRERKQTSGGYIWKYSQ